MRRSWKRHSLPDLICLAATVKVGSSARTGVCFGRPSTRRLLFREHMSNDKHLETVYQQIMVCHVTYTHLYGPLSYLGASRHFSGNVSVRSITIPILYVLFGFYISALVVATILYRHILSFVHLGFLISRRHGGSEDTQAGINTPGGRIGGWGGLLECYLWVSSLFCLQGWFLGGGAGKERWEAFWKADWWLDWIGLGWVASDSIGLDACLQFRGMLCKHDMTCPLSGWMSFGSNT